MRQMVIAFVLLANVISVAVFASLFTNDSVKKTTKSRAAVLNQESFFNQADHLAGRESFEKNQCMVATSS